MSDAPQPTILQRCGFTGPASLTACAGDHAAARRAVLDCISILSGDANRAGGDVPLSVESSLDESNLGMDASWTLRYKTFSESGMEIGYLNHVAAQHIPAARDTIAGLVARGYTLDGGRVTVTRIHAVQHGQELIGYSVEDHVELVKDDAAIIVGVNGHGNTLLGTLGDAQAAVTEIEYRGPAAPLGRGQAQACSQIAHNVADKHRCDWIGPDVHVVVPFITRGSRADKREGRTKIAHRRFTASELA